MVRYSHTHTHAYIHLLQEGGTNDVVNVARSSPPVSFVGSHEKGREKKEDDVSSLFVARAGLLLFNSLSRAIIGKRAKKEKERHVTAAREENTFVTHTIQKKSALRSSLVTGKKSKLLA